MGVAAPYVVSRSDDDDGDNRPVFIEAGHDNLAEVATARSTLFTEEVDTRSTPARANIKSGNDPGKVRETTNLKYLFLK